jgi:polysaccharide export outer membrane protein
MLARHVAVILLSLYAHAQRQPPLPVTSSPTSLAGEEYQIGRDDLVEITVFEAQDLGATSRVSASGMLTLPLIGPVKAEGQTTEQLARAIENQLRQKYVNDPHVSVFVRDYASQPVSILGAVKAPGIYQLKGQKFLLDMLAMAQGLDASAGKTIQVMRRSSDAASPTDPNGAVQTDTINIDVTDLFQNGKTDLNIRINAGDVINVQPALSVFVVGEFVRPGEFPLHYGKPITVAQAVALGGGFSRDAKKAAGSIIRYHADKTKEEIPVNIEKILDGSADDIPLMANDILFVPSSKVKTGLSRALDSALSIAVGRAIYIH